LSIQLQQSAELVEVTATESIREIIDHEYSFGLSHFQEALDRSLTNLSSCEIAFLSTNINLLIYFGDAMMQQASALFNNYGLIVDAKHVYWFVVGIRDRIRLGISGLLLNQSADQIKMRVNKLYRTYTFNLKTIVQTDVDSFIRAVQSNEDLLECWESYKVLIFELGLDTIGEFTSVVRNARGKVQSDARRNILVGQPDVRRFVCEIRKCFDKSIENQRLRKLNERRSRQVSDKQLGYSLQIENNQRTIHDQIDAWLLEIATSLQRATKSVQMGAQQLIQEAQIQFGELRREILNCVTVDVNAVDVDE